VWKLGGKTYSMHSSFSDKVCYNMFIEDCAMMLYRLNGGEGYNTMTLVDDIVNDTL